MRRRLLVHLAALIGLALYAPGCAALVADTVIASKDTFKDITRTSNLKAHAVPSIKTLQVNRVAVMPVAEEPVGTGEPMAPGAAESITAELYSQVAIAGGWAVVPLQDVETAMQKLPPTTVANEDQNALKLGHDVSADGVIYGTVERYKERVGMDYSASSPASVTFSLKFVDLKTQQIVWTGKFAKSQAALSENVFDLANFVQRSGRWVRAHEIALEGVKAAVGDLHGDLNLQQNVRRFETGTYGQLKSGQQRYTSGPEGIQ